MEQELRFLRMPDGVNICCAKTGEGPPLVKAPNWLSHAGFDRNSPVWRHWWQELSRNHRFVRFDQRGCGLSDWQAADMSFNAWVTDLEEVVDALKLDRFALLGMSQGGAVAVEYAARHPERVTHLVLAGAFAQGWAKRGQPSRDSQALLTLIIEGWGSDNPAYRQIFTSQFMPDATADQMNWFNELERVSASPENAVRLWSEVGSIDVVDRLASIAVPTLVFHSQNDARVPFEQGRLIAATIPGARFIPLESNNHILLETEPAWQVFVSEKQRFLGEGLVANNLPAAGVPRLTPREMSVLRLIAAGKTDREIANELSLSVRTVGNHVKKILDKTDSPNRTAAAMHAMRLGIL